MSKYFGLRVSLLKNTTPEVKQQNLRIIKQFNTLLTDPLMLKNGIDLNDPKTLEAYAKTRFDVLYKHYPEFKAKDAKLADPPYNLKEFKGGCGCGG